MNTLLRKILRRIGVNVSRFKASPYEYLLDAARYREMIVELAGDDFKIADSLSFYYSFKEIFYEEIYNFRSSTTTPLILDCGSNYGTSVLFFKTVFPGSHIVAVEADPGIFQLLKWNIEKRNYADITLLNKAVSASATPLAFYREYADSGRLYPIEECKNIVQVETVILDELITGPVDFLKMDIEGAESEVICSSEKLRDVSQIFFEYHSFRDTEQSLGAILEKLRDTGFRYFIHTQFCSPRPFLEEKVRLGQDLQLNIFARRMN